MNESAKGNFDTKDDALANIDLCFTFELRKTFESVLYAFRVSKRSVQALFVHHRGQYFLLRSVPNSDNVKSYLLPIFEKETTMALFEIKR